MSKLIDRVLRAVLDCHDGSDLWAHARRDPEAFRAAIRRVLPDEAIVGVGAVEAAEELAREVRALHARLTYAQVDGIRACVNVVEERIKHYELYRCDCLDRDPGNGHRPGCKGEMMSTHPATFAILDEIRTFLLALMGRAGGQAG